MAVIPPGAVGDLDEDPDARTCWRTLWWPDDSDYDDAWGTDGEPSRAFILPIADLLVIVGNDQRERVRHTCQTQLAHLRRFSAGLDGRPDDDRAREASRVLSRLHRELDDAFPRESWHQREAAQLEPVPDTVVELLRAVDGDTSAPSRAERVLVVLLREYWRAIAAYRTMKRAGREPHAVVGRLTSRSRDEPPCAEAPPCHPEEHLATGS